VSPVEAPSYSVDRERLTRLLAQRMLTQNAAQSGHDLVALSLKRAGVTHVHGISGNPVDVTMAACARHGLRVIGARHQQGAVLAAAAQNFAAGALRAAVIVSAGPAVTNCATGLLVARDNRWPVLVIGGRRALSMRGRGSFQDFDGDAFFAPLVKSCALVSSAAQIESSLRAACDDTMGASPGPVYIDIVEEALEGSAALEMPLATAGTASPPATAQPAHGLMALDEVARTLALSERPVLLVGDGARWAQPWAELNRLVDTHSVPFATTPMARGFLPEAHPLCLTEVRGPLLAAADVVLVVGARFDWMLRFGMEMGPEATVVFIGLDAAEAALSFGRGTPLVGDAAATLRMLLGQLEVERAAGSLVDVDSGWTTALQAHAQSRREAVSAQNAEAAHPMHPLDWLGEAAPELPADAITVLDGNVVMSAAQHVLKAGQPMSRLTPGQNGCMGTGIPFGIGVKLACPSRPVVVVCGDFAFGLSMMEMETAVRHRVPIIVIVANNSGPGGSTRQQSHYPADHPERVCQYTPGIRHDLMVAALGGQGFHVEKPGELALALRQALAFDGPTCIDVLTHEDAPLFSVV
jgi:2-hydroxyacyl-CoA lyase 1